MKGDSSGTSSGSPALSSADARALPVLYRMAALATRVIEPRAALAEMLDLAIATFGANAGAIVLLSPDTGRLETEVQVGNAAAGPDSGLKIGHGITGWCALNRRPLLVPDVSTEPRYIAVRPWTRCEMAAPMMEEDVVLGVFDLESDRVNGFSPADLQLLERMAAEAGRVMQRLWQLAHLQAKGRQLESLITAGRSLVTKLDPQELFDTLTREARQMIGIRAAALYLYDETAETLRCASYHGEAGGAGPNPRPAAAVVKERDEARPGPLPSAALPLSACLMATAIHTRRAVAFADVQSPEFRELSDVPVDPAIASVLATPVLYEGRVLGVLAVFTGTVHRFDNDEKRLCAALATLGAVALENARLYGRVFESEDALRKNERLTTLGLLAAEIAHEIRNPLTVLKLLVGGLGVDFPADDPRRTDMRVIGEKLDQLEAIVSRVLNFAKAPSSLHSRWSLAEIVADTLLLVRLKFSQSKVSLAFEPPPHPIFVDAHKGQIQQVLLNLLLNATHAMPEGGRISIAIGTDERKGAPVAHVDLADSGRGIPAAIRDRMFDSFLSGRPDGTGLGLAIAKRIMLSHHGDLTLLNTGPSGTTMRITLPLAK